MANAQLFLIPSMLGDGDLNRIMVPYNRQVIEELWYFVVENEKSARRFIKKVCPDKKQSDLHIEILNKKTDSSEIPFLLQPLLEGKSVGIISEAGLPGVADPGARLVAAAHAKNIKVVPLVGASSILMALMASGFNGNSFSFTGYLPIDKKDRKKSIQDLERKSKQTGSAEIFMETPYRNNNLIKDLQTFLHPNTQLCVACDITLASEFIYSGTIKKWKSVNEDFHKRPAIFIIQA